MKIRTEDELRQAIDNDVESIEIEGDLGKKIIKIKATGKAAWIVAFGAIIVVVGSMLITVGTGGTSAPATGASGFVAGSVAVTTLGYSTVATIVSMCVATGSIATAKLLFGKLRDNYNISEKENIVTLTRKNKV